MDLDLNMQKAVNLLQIYCYIIFQQTSNLPVNFFHCLPQHMRIARGSEKFDDRGFELGFGEFHECAGGRCQFPFGVQMRLETCF